MIHFTGPISYKPQVDFLIDQIQTWPKEWFVKFKVIVHDFNTPDIWNTLIHFTIGENFGTYGERVPGFWIHKPTETFTFSFDYKDSQISWQLYRFDWSGQIELGREYDIHIQSEAAFHERQNIHKIWGSIDGVEVCSVYNYQAEILQNVKIYVGNPWHGVFSQSVVKDLEYGPLN